MSGVAWKVRAEKDALPVHSSGEAWERFISAEHRNLLARQRGQLRLALGEPLPGEFEEEIEWMAREDQRRAGEGLVELRGKKGIYHKRLEDLTPGNLPDRLAAEAEKCEWLMNRMDERMRRIRKDWEKAG